MRRAALLCLLLLLAGRALADGSADVAEWERRLAIQEAAGDRAGVALTLVALGELWSQRGEHARAAATLERAARIAEELNARSLLGEALAALAAARLAVGDVGAALAAARRAAAAMETMEAGLSDDERVGARARLAQILAIGVEAGSRSKDAAETWFFLESGRAGALLEALVAREALQAVLVPETRRLEEERARRAEADATAELARASDPPDRARMKAAREALDRARSRLVEVLERIQRDAKRAAGVFYPRPDGLEEIQGAAAADEVVVSYAFTRGVARAMVVTSESARVVPLGSSEPIFAAVEVLHGAWRDEGAETDAGTLRALVTDPLALPEGARSVVVVPDGPLALVPPILLFPGRDVSYVPSGSTWRLLLERRGRQGEGVLAIADPRAGPLGSLGRGRSLPPLPATREEAKAVGDVLLLGEEATEPGLAAALAKRPRWRAVHFACHALVDVERPAFSSLALTPDAENDGFLTTLDVFRMSIPADLVVLAGSDTARGRVVAGEGVVGLVRAFLFAGTPRVIASLALVDDESTQALMTRFYERWKGGSPTAAALREAQEHVRSQERWKHPRYWAPWVLWGLGD